LPPPELSDDPDESVPSSSRMTVDPSSWVVSAGGSVGCGVVAGGVVAVAAGGAGGVGATGGTGTDASAAACSAGLAADGLE
jgi:hypothetical protein